MPLYDFACRSGHKTETDANWKQKEIVCPKCGKKATRCFSPASQYVPNEDAPWLRSVLEVVDKENKAPHVQEFVKNPTRSNYQRWMKGEGIRPLDHTEHGAPPVHKQRPEPDLTPMVKELARRHMERNRIEVR